MAYVKNVWTDQNVERPRTYQMSENQDGSVTLIDDFGLVADLGTPVNADNMNHIEDGIEGCYDDLVNKSGDTMSGNLSFEGTGQGTVSIEVADDSFADVNFVDENQQRIGHLRAYNQGANKRTIEMVAMDDSGTPSGNGIRTVYENNSVSCEFPNTDRCDGQWVNTYENIISDTSLKSSTGAALNKTVTLPNDGCTYMVYLRAIIETGSSSGNYVRLLVSSNKLVNRTYVCSAVTKSASSVFAIGWACLPMTHGTNNLQINRDAGYTGTASISVIGYRRIGKNE